MVCLSCIVARCIVALHCSGCIVALHCSCIVVLVENSGTMVNDVRLREGYARLDCAFPEGGTLKVDLKFSGCD